MENANDLWSVFMTKEFGIACVAIVAIMWTLKKAAKQAAPALYIKGWFQAIMTLLNLGFGCVVAIPKDFLVGKTYGQRVLLGLCAGLLSHTFYSAVIKRITAFVEGRSTDKEAARTSASIAAVPESTPKPGNPEGGK